MKHAISATWLANPNRDRSHLPHNFRSSYKYLIYHRSEDSLPHSVVIQVPQSIEPRFWVANFEDVV